MKNVYKMSLSTMIMPVFNKVDECYIWCIEMDEHKKMSIIIQKGNVLKYIILLKHSMYNIPGIL